MLGITAAPKPALPDYANNGPIQRRFSPYNDNGGSTVAIAGENYAIVASDTRLTDGGEYQLILSYFTFSFSNSKT